MSDSGFTSHFFIFSNIVFKVFLIAKTRNKSIIFTLYLYILTQNTVSVTLLKWWTDGSLWPPPPLSKSDLNSSASPIFTCLTPWKRLFTGPTAFIGADRLPLLDLWTKVHSTVNPVFHKRQPDLRERSSVGPRPVSKSEGSCRWLNTAQCHLCGFRCKCNICNSIRY